MKIVKFPDSLPDLVIKENKHEYGLGVFILTPEKWCMYRTGANYVDILLKNDAEYDGGPDAGKRRYHINFELNGFHECLSNQEKDQLSLLFLSYDGIEALT